MNRRRTWFVWILFLSMPVWIWAEDCPAGSFTVTDTHQAVYPPIARAAHISGRVRVFTTLQPEGDVSGTQAVEGPEMLRAAAEHFVHGWSVKVDPAMKKPCIADITVAFGLLPATSETPTVELRQGHEDTAHWLIESTPIVISDPSSDKPGHQPVRCVDLLITRSDTPVYPPIALAARVDGYVSLEIKLDANAQVKEVKVVDGPKMLAGAAEAYVKSWEFGWQSDRRHKSCVEIVAVQYRVLPQLPATSSFSFERVTRDGFSDTYVVSRPPYVKDIIMY